MTGNDNVRMVIPEEFWSSGEYLSHLCESTDCVFCRKLRNMRYLPWYKLRHEQSPSFNHLMDLYAKAYLLQRYEIEITEKYRRHVVIYAKNVARAEDIAEELCDCGEIDMDRNCYEGRTLNTSISYAPYDSDGPDTYMEEKV